MTNENQGKSGGSNGNPGGGGDNDKGKPPKPELFKLQIDKDKYETANQTPSGRELLGLAGKVPAERYQIFQRQSGGELREIPLDQRADLAAPGQERFITLPLDQTEGEGTAPPPRRDFLLSEADTDILDSLGLQWETLALGGVARVVIRGYPIPAGYKCTTADLSLKIEPNYPTTQIDMVYFFPPLARSDGKGINNLSNDVFEGKGWQQWSRHRTAANPWRPDIDNVGTHLKLVDHWLAREIAKG